MRMVRVDRDSGPDVEEQRSKDYYQKTSTRCSGFDVLDRRNGSVILYLALSPSR